MGLNEACVFLCSFLHNARASDSDEFHSDTQNSTIHQCQIGLQYKTLIYVQEFAVWHDSR